jgi:hypothetical protein
MPIAVLFDGFATVQVAVIYLTIVVGGLATLFSVIYLGARAIPARTVRTRLRAGVVAAIILIVLAALDVYLAIVQLSHLVS